MPLDSVDRGNVVGHPTPYLQGATGLATAVIGGTTYLFAAGGADDGVSVFEVGSDGSLAQVEIANDDPTSRLDRPVDATTAAVGGTTYLFVSGSPHTGVGVLAADAKGFFVDLRLGAPGRLRFQWLRRPDA